MPSGGCRTGHQSMESGRGKGLLVAVMKPPYFGIESTPTSFTASLGHRHPASSQKRGRRPQWSRRGRTATSMIGFDPIFQGLVISLMAGEVASLLLSRMTVPILFCLSESRKHRHAPRFPE